MATMAGTGKGAEQGVLIRDAEALETLERADTLVVDKTGTLTEASPTCRLSRLTMRGIRQNLFLAFACNALSIPLAALGLISPVWAAAAMSLSSLSVVGNSLRLRRAPL
jgi:Cu+-exporting ATPase